MIPSFPRVFTFLICSNVGFTGTLPSCRRYKEKKEEVAEPEADPERDQRTVFAYQVIHCIMFYVPYFPLLILRSIYLCM